MFKPNNLTLMRLVLRGFVLFENELITKSLYFVYSEVNNCILFSLDFGLAFYWWHLSFCFSTDLCLFVFFTNFNQIVFFVFFFPCTALNYSRSYQASLYFIFDPPFFVCFWIFWSGFFSRFLADLQSSSSWVFIYFFLWTIWSVLKYWNNTIGRVGAVIDH